MIKISKNKLMQDIINNIDNSEIYTSSGVSHLIKRDLEITNNYVIFADPNGYPKEFIESWKNDWAGLEGNVNDIHVDHALDTSIKDMEQRINHGILHGLFQKSIIACEEIFSLFKHHTEIEPSDEFTIVFSIDSYNPEIDADRDEITETSSSLRFTKKRDGNSWLDHDLEVFAQPIMTIDFNKESVEILSKNWWTTS